MAISDDSKKVAAACDGRAGATLWDVTTGNVIDQISLQQLQVRRRSGGHPVWSVAFVPGDSDQCAIGGDGYVVLWDSVEKTVIKLNGYSSDSIFMSLDFSPDGRYLVAGGGQRTNFDDQQHGETLVWDLRQLPNTQPVHRISHYRIVYSVAFAPDGREIAAGGLDSVVKICHVGDWSETNIGNQSWWITGLAYTPCGERLVTARPSGDVTFWDRRDPKDSKEIGTLKLDERIRRIAISPNGLVTASSEGYIRFWKAMPMAEEM